MALFASSSSPASRSHRRHAGAARSITSASLAVASSRVIPPSSGLSSATNISPSSVPPRNPPHVNTSGPTPAVVCLHRRLADAAAALASAADAPLGGPPPTTPGGPRGGVERGERQRVVHHRAPAEAPPLPQPGPDASGVLVPRRGRFPGRRRPLPPARRGAWRRVTDASLTRRRHRRGAPPAAEEQEAVARGAAARAHARRGNIPARVHLHPLVRLVRGVEAPRVAQRSLAVVAAVHDETSLRDKARRRARTSAQDRARGRRRGATPGRPAGPARANPRTPNRRGRCRPGRRPCSRQPPRSAPPGARAARPRPRAYPNPGADVEAVHIRGGAGEARGGRGGRWEREGRRKGTASGKRA